MGSPSPLIPGFIAVSLQGFGVRHCRFPLPSPSLQLAQSSRHAAAWSFPSQRAALIAWPDLCPAPWNRSRVAVVATCCAAQLYLSVCRGSSGSSLLPVPARSH